MKTIQLLSVIALIFVYSCKPSAPAGEASVADMKSAIDSSKLVSLEIDVQGMTCTGCESTIETGILALPGVTKADANFVTGKTMVNADTTVTNSAGIKAAIEAKGYVVKASTVVEKADTTSL